RPSNSSEVSTRRLCARLSAEMSPPGTATVSSEAAPFGACEQAAHSRTDKRSDAAETDFIGRRPAGREATNIRIRHADIPTGPGMTRRWHATRIQPVGAASAATGLDMGSPGLRSRLKALPRSGRTALALAALQPQLLPLPDHVARRLDPVRGRQDLGVALVA